MSEATELLAELKNDVEVFEDYHQLTEEECECIPEPVNDDYERHFEDQLQLIEQLEDLIDE